MLRNDLKYVEAHGQISARLLERTGQLEGLALQQMGPEAAAQAADLNAAVEIYIKSFADLVSVNTVLGLDVDSGLEGTLREAVHAIAASLEGFENPVMQVEMLMMRRHEKDFIMRGDQKHVDRLNARVQRVSDNGLSFA